ncbi:ADP-ribosylglycohydrolase family protein [Congregibacter litoralis]|uniref:ADP-ribosylglycohydrolase family protein n=1 Tax=Congregibacter litoralis TaxID=393662 RepID=UPI00006BE056|nr:ADP-ribosylglycohydrolase family protein [Congregibacter litoralis]
MLISVDIKDRGLGALLGLAVGDALGTTLEFKSPGTFEPISDMMGGGPFGLKPGQWTDDTSMALCLAASLIESEGFDATDQMQRYCRWWHEGYLSSTGTCFDIGNTVLGALFKFEQTGDPMAGSVDPQTAGNGSLMRLAPIPLFYANSPSAAIERAAQMSRTTHGADEAVDACRYYTGLIVGALNGQSKDALCGSYWHPSKDFWDPADLASKVAEVAGGSFKRKPAGSIRGTGYVVDAIEAALWAFWSTTNFRDGALAAVNLGDDADTTGAIYGQLAGAHYGCAGIPLEWVERLHACEHLTELAERLLVAGEMHRSLSL